MDQYGPDNYMMYKITHNMQVFLMMMCEEFYAKNLPKVLNYKNTQTPMVSSNGCLMLLACGMRDAVTNYYDHIINFLK